MITEKFKIYSFNAKGKVPLNVKKDKVGMYVCGPTVYDVPHIGNYRTFVFFDAVYRVLSYTYGQVTYVRNITDLDDKIEKKSIDTGVSTEVIVSENTKAFHEELYFLNCATPTYEPKATESMADIILFIERLLKTGYAYKVQGNIYFDTTKYDKYHSIFHNIIHKAGCISGESNIDIQLKKNPQDFILWKSITQKHQKREYVNGYTSPWGMGRPGWHIECSAMSVAYFDNMIDIHGGGKDLMFPHHVNEFAQSDAYCGNKFRVSHWMHNSFITVNGKKMSKSLGNVINISSLRKKYSGDAIRFFLLNNHYRNEIDFNESALNNAEGYINSIFVHCEGEEDVGAIPSNLLEYIQDDFHFAGLFSKIKELINKGQIHTKSVVSIFKLLGFKFINEVDRNKIDIAIRELVYLRNEDRRNHNWNEADTKRRLLESKGYMVFDLDAKTVVRKR